MASTRLICFSSTLSAAFCSPENGPIDGQHAHQVLHRSHLLDLPQLVAKVFEREAVAVERLGGHLRGFLLVDLRFGALDQRQNVAHAEDARNNAVGMEGLERIVLFTDADELDGLAGDLADRKRRAATGIAIHFCKYDAGERQASCGTPRRS